jgi:outer membrane receptor protein involved in Fe transport
MNLSNAKLANKALTFVAITLFLAAGALSAATVSGVITDSRTGDYLPGANVMLEGTNYGTASDRSGGYRITGVPAGEYVLVVNYIGFDEFSNDITVSFDSNLNRNNCELTASFIGMDEVIVSVLRTGEAKALSQQKSSDKIQNVISTEQIEKFPDPNAAEALSRLPGVSVQKDHGEGRYILIRGSAARLNSTQINGNTLPSPEDDNRNVSLDVIPSDLLAGIEVSKALTPDMDGDAIGGSVNLISKTAFDFDKRVIKADFTGGYKALRGGVGEKATFTFADVYMDGKLGVLIGGSYNNDNRATDNIELEWADAYETVTNVVDDWEVEEDEDDDGNVFLDSTAIYEVDEVEDVKVLNDIQMNYYDVRRH